MGKWPREEIEQAFEQFQALARESCATGDWSIWCSIFTEDAEYVEHLHGDFHGKAEILGWLQPSMKDESDELGSSAMVGFPIEWYVIDEERGWVVCQVWNELADPGDGRRYAAFAWTLLKYAGGGKFCYEEDIYNPQEFRDVATAWTAVKATHDGTGRYVVGGPRLAEAGGQSA